jgi:hypothetical protein
MPYLLICCFSCFESIEVDLVTESNVVDCRGIRRIIGQTHPERQRQLECVRATALSQTFVQPVHPVGMRRLVSLELQKISILHQGIGLLWLDQYCLARQRNRITKLTEQSCLSTRQYCWWSDFIFYFERVDATYVFA